ncbi:MAG TPA: YfiR family protein, partial [Nitrosomonas sp.]|nr:YfiR family protein [Nitrosomonas sp.]
ISSLPSILAFVQGQSILTIADTPDAAIKGIMINMIVAQNRILFEINLQSARNAKLDISSKLLQLAMKVYQ